MCSHRTTSQPPGVGECGTVPWSSCEICLRVPREDACVRRVRLLFLSRAYARHVKLLVRQTLDTGFGWTVCELASHLCDLSTVPYGAGQDSQNGCKFPGKFPGSHRDVGLKVDSKALP